MADFPGFPNPDKLQVAEAFKIMHENEILPVGAGNYELTAVNKHKKFLKTFNRPIHSGLYIVYDPTGLKLDFK
jgi:hypothetical protein